MMDYFIYSKTMEQEEKVFRTKEEAQEAFTSEVEDYHSQDCEIGACRCNTDIKKFISKVWDSAYWGSSAYPLKRGDT